MTDEKKEEKRPLDMTTDEAMEFLLGEEGARKLKEGVREQFPPQPEGGDKGSGTRAKSSSRKHGTT
ncbi:MAG TPA: hypothetical protein VF546_04580 [Pyrinomonadaceae bacterium]|jgi:hypothetical protein